MMTATYHLMDRRTAISYGSSGPRKIGIVLGKTEIPPAKLWIHDKDVEKIVFIQDHLDSRPTKKNPRTKYEIALEHFRRATLALNKRLISEEIAGSPSAVDEAIKRKMKRAVEHEIVSDVDIDLSMLTAEQCTAIMLID